MTNNSDLSEKAREENRLIEFASDLQSKEKRELSLIMVKNAEIGPLKCVKLIWLIGKAG